MTLKKLLPILLLIIFSCLPITAQSFNEWDANFIKKVSKNTNVTYLDLVKKIFPESQLSKSSNSEMEKVAAAKSIPIRDLFGEHREKIYENISIGLKEELLTKYGEEKLLWLIISIDGIKDPDYFAGATNLLAAFRVKKDEAEILDVADIGFSNLIGFGDDDLSAAKRRLEILPQQEAVVIYDIQNTGLGSSQYSIISIDEKGFHLILSPFYLEHNIQCGGGFEETIRFRLIKNKTKKYPNLEVIVTTFSSYEDEPESAKPEFIKKFHYYYVWKLNEQKYAASGNFKTTDKNRKAFRRRIKEGCGTS